MQMDFPSNSYETIKNNDVCRACTMNFSRDSMVFLFEKSNVADIFSKCTSINVTTIDGLPEFICQQCHSLLLHFYEFRLKCTQSDAFFRQKKAGFKVESDFNSSHEGLEHKETPFTSLNISNRNNDDPEEMQILPDFENLQPKPEFDNLHVDDDSEEDHHDDSEEEYNDDDDVSSDGIKKEVVVKKRRKRNRKKDAPPKDLFKCDMCDKRFFKKHRLEGHLRTHQGLKPCVCKTCGKEFSKWGGLTVHMTIAHSEIKTEFACDYPDCTKTYSMKQSLVSHKKKVHSGTWDPSKEIAKYMCETCGKSFKTNSALKKHTYTHTGLMPFKCTICPRKYPTKHKLKEHQMRHDGIKNHICPFCGLRKTTQNELKTHINYHTRDKQYPCKMCPAIFSNIGNMSRHVKIVHCGIKAYNCTFCERSFGKAETLKHHIMTHTGEKPHGCEVCGKRFIQSIALQTHMRTHNKKGVASSTPLLITPVPVPSN